MSDLYPSHPVTIIGAGLSGLACARFLQDAGIESVVFDRGRHPGGRVATKQIAHKEDLHLFNHGAPMKQSADRKKTKKQDSENTKVLCVFKISYEIQSTCSVSE